MSIKSYFKKFIGHLYNHNEDQSLPKNFKEAEIVRKRVEFFGNVIGVGFRITAYNLANKLELLGFVKNTEKGSVLMEVEGNKNKVNYLINSLASLKRAPLSDLKSFDIEVLSSEEDFKIIY